MTQIFRSRSAPGVCCCLLSLVDNDIIRPEFPSSIGVYLSFKDKMFFLGSAVSVFVQNIRDIVVP